MTWLGMCLLAISLLPASSAFAQDYFQQLQDKLGLSSEEKTDAATQESASSEALPSPTTPERRPSENRNPTLEAPAISPVPTPFSTDDSPLTEDQDATLGPMAERGPVDRPYLGVTVEQMQEGGLGLRVVEVTRNAPGWKAGITPGDNLLAIDGTAISSLDQFAGEILKRSPSEVVKCVIDRRGRTITLPVVLGSTNMAERSGTKPPQMIPQQPYVPIGPGLDGGNTLDPNANDLGSANVEQRASLGVTVERMSAAIRDQLGIPVYRGAVVQMVAPNSPAFRGGLQPGDCIVEVDGVVIQSDVDLLNWVLAAQPGQIAQMRFFRGRNLQTANIRLEATSLATPLPSESRLRPQVENDSEPWQGSDPSLNADQVRQLESQIQAMQRELQRAQEELESLKKNR